MPDGLSRSSSVHHHQVAGAECAVEPVGIAETGGQLAQPVPDAILDERHAFAGPGLVASMILAV